MVRVVLGYPTASPLVLVALLSPLAAGLLDGASAQRVDCRKFVFAPSCRGVAAKRSDAAPGRGVRSDVGLEDEAEMPRTLTSGNPGRPLGRVLRLSADRVGASRTAWGGGRPSNEGGHRLPIAAGSDAEFDPDEEGVGPVEEAWLGSSAWGAAAAPDSDAEEVGDDAWTEEEGDFGTAIEGGGQQHSRWRKTTARATSQGHRKAAKIPAAYDWFPSDSGHHRRRRGGGDRVSPESVVNYDY